jgi:kynurenine formamidase
MSYKLIDLSHEVKEGMITYTGLSVPIICDYLSREDSRKHYSGFHFHTVPTKFKVFRALPVPG